LEIHERYVVEARRRIAENIAEDVPGSLLDAG
jgi:hypothetical protein